MQQIVMNRTKPKQPNLRGPRYQVCSFCHNSECTLQWDCVSQKSQLWRTLKCAMKMGGHVSSFLAFFFSSLIMMPWKFLNTQCKVFGLLIHLYVQTKNLTNYTFQSSNYQHLKSIQPP